MCHVFSCAVKTQTALTRDFVVQLVVRRSFEDVNKSTPKTDFSRYLATNSGRYQCFAVFLRLLFSSVARLECGCPELATHFEPRLAGFRANVHGRLNGALGVKTRRERRWRSAR